MPNRNLPEKPDRSSGNRNVVPASSGYPNFVRVFPARRNVAAVTGRDRPLSSELQALVAQPLAAQPLPAPGPTGLTLLAQLIAPPSAEHEQAKQPSAEHEQA